MGAEGAIKSFSDFVLKARSSVANIRDCNRRTKLIFRETVHSTLSFICKIALPLHETAKDTIPIINNTLNPLANAAKTLVNKVCHFYKLLKWLIIVWIIALIIGGTGMWEPISSTYKKASLVIYPHLLFIWGSPVVWLGVNYALLFISVLICIILMTKIISRCQIKRENNRIYARNLAQVVKSGSAVFEAVQK